MSEQGDVFKAFCNSSPLYTTGDLVAVVDKEEDSASTAAASGTLTNESYSLGYPDIPPDSVTLIDLKPESPTSFDFLSVDAGFCSPIAPVSDEHRSNPPSPFPPPVAFPSPPSSPSLPSPPSPIIEQLSQELDDAEVEVQMELDISDTDHVSDDGTVTLDDMNSDDLSPSLHFVHVPLRMKTTRSWTWPDPSENHYSDDNPHSYRVVSYTTASTPSEVSTSSP